MKRLITVIIPIVVVALVSWAWCQCWEPSRNDVVAPSSFYFSGSGFIPNIFVDNTFVPDVPAVSLKPDRVCVQYSIVQWDGNQYDKYVEVPRWTCADKSRILMTDEDGGKHCIKFSEIPLSADYPNLPPGTKWCDKTKSTICDGGGQP